MFLFKLHISYSTFLRSYLSDKYSIYPHILLHYNRRKFPQIARHQHRVLHNCNCTHTRRQTHNQYMHTCVSVCVCVRSGLQTVCGASVWVCVMHDWCAAWARRLKAESKLQLSYTWRDWESHTECPSGGSGNGRRRWRWKWEWQSWLHRSQIAMTSRIGLCAWRVCLAATGDPDHKPGASLVQLSGSWINRT